MFPMGEPMRGLGKLPRKVMQVISIGEGTVCLHDPDTGWNEAYDAPAAMVNGVEVGKSYLFELGAGTLFRFREVDEAYAPS